jgi:tRNA dimethylallyltransferase
MKKQAIFLMGPTASGKTSLAIELVKHLPVDIISVDSAMIYRGLDIGTGKPTSAELSIAPHKLIDICEPTESYSTARFCHDAEIAMQESWQQNRIPLLVGGTMLYFKALQFGLATLPSADSKLREQLTAQAENLGWPAMHAKLAELDPITATRLSMNDSQRIQRALEINILTGKPLSESYGQQEKKILDYNLLPLAIIPTDRSKLHAAIEKRFINMLELGLMAEVEGLYTRGDLNPLMPSMRSVGYRQVWSYLAGETDFNTMRENAIAATRQLAKRQFTWLRSWPDIINLGDYTSTTLKTIIDLI